MPKTFDELALDYHKFPKPGKLEIVATKPLASQRDLALAYSPGVAKASEAIAEDPDAARDYTARGNLVAVISNGSAVLGLGNIGALAAKPVMEGKAVLFKRFAGVDVFDIEIDAPTPAEMIDTIRRLQPTFGGINLEDIKAPECFEVESTLREQLSIPVFHDDQHGTAIVASAGVVNGLKIANKKIEDCKVVGIGAGAAGIACLRLMVDLGIKKENIFLYDRSGLITTGRNNLSPEKAQFAQNGPNLPMEETIVGADIFLGVSAPGGLTGEMVKTMADSPLILALANPVPEIMPEEAQAVRPDAIIATGRSDYPNQVNNVLCFPYIFRGALDVGATEINEAMKVACVHAIAGLAQVESVEAGSNTFADESPSFGREYVIPRPFDPRLILEVAPAVAKAAMESGVASRPIEDLDAYRESLERFVYRSGMLMKPIFEKAKREPKRIAFAEGEAERVLRATQAIVDEGLGKPVLVGRPEVIARRIEKLGLRLEMDRDLEICNPQSDPRYEDYWQTYHRLAGRQGVSQNLAKTIVRTNTTVIAALMVYKGDADAMLCGTTGGYGWHQKYVEQVIGLAETSHRSYALSTLITDKGTLFISDSHAQVDPTSEEIVEMTLLGAREIRRFGIEPKVALISHSNLGSHESPSARKMRAAAATLKALAPDLMVDGEMHVSTALDPALRSRLLPESSLEGAANFLVFANMDAANSAYNLLVAVGNALPVGPILMGTRQPAHVLSPSVTARGVLNMAAMAVVEAQAR
ncbi:MAG: NADP-dependent malic enzyme [Magnetospiraceae bacterium]